MYCNGFTSIFFQSQKKLSDLWEQEILIHAVFLRDSKFDKNKQFAKVYGEVVSSEEKFHCYVGGGILVEKFSEIINLKPLHPYRAYFLQSTTEGGKKYSDIFFMDLSQIALDLSNMYSDIITKEEQK